MNIDEIIDFFESLKYYDFTKNDTQIIFNFINQNETKISELSYFFEILYCYGYSNQQALKIFESLNINKIDLQTISEFFESLCDYGYEKEEAIKLYHALNQKYGDLSKEEYQAILYNAMTSCRQRNDLSINERLIYLDGIIYTFQKYSKEKNEYAKLTEEEIKKKILKDFFRYSEDILTEEEKKLCEEGIIDYVELIEQLERQSLISKYKKL